MEAHESGVPTLEIVKQIPELAGMNQKESDFINLDGYLEKAVGRAANRSPGVTSAVVGGAVGAGTRSPVAGITAALAKEMASSQMVSRIAIGLNKYATRTGRAAPSLTTISARLKNYADAIQNGMNAVPVGTPSLQPNLALGASQ